MRKILLATIFSVLSFLQCAQAQVNQIKYNGAQVAQEIKLSKDDVINIEAFVEPHTEFVVIIKSISHDVWLTGINFSCNVGPACIRTANFTDSVTAGRATPVQLQYTYTNSDAAKFRVTVEPVKK